MFAGNEVLMESGLFAEKGGKLLLGHSSNYKLGTRGKRRWNIRTYAMHGRYLIQKGPFHGGDLFNLI